MDVKETNETVMQDQEALNEITNYHADLNQEPSSIMMPLLQGYEYPISHLQPMLDLLKDWSLECLYQKLLDELIDIKILSIMKSEYINELLSEYPIGIKILFAHKLENWQKTLSQNTFLKSHTIFQNTSSNKVIPQQKDIGGNVIHLGNILSSSSTGTMIVNYYETNNKLNDNIRTLLMDTIFSYIITQKLSMSVGLADVVGDQIVAMFPSEVKDTYFLKYDRNKNPKGKLYAKYYNSMRTLKTSGLISANSNSKTSASSLNRKHMDFEPETNIQYILDQIRYDTNCSFPELENNWRATTKFRLNEIQNTSSTSIIIYNWKSYTLPLGYRLVDIDFNTLYPNCSSLLDTFDEKSIKISDLLDEKIKDSASRKLFENLKDASNICPNGKNTVLFYLLHAIFIPTSKKVTRDHNGKKCLVKYSIKDSQNSFIIFKNSVCEIEEYINIRRDENNPIQPFILIVGTPIHPKEIIIFFDSIKYKVFTILNAIDVCFKLFHLFNLEYPPESCIVWTFIQKYFYTLSTKFDKPCHTLGQVLSDLSLS